MSFNNYTYAICDVATDLSNIDFNQTVTTSANTIRKSIDESLFVIKWISTPTFISDDTVVPSETLDHADALTLMQTEAWTSPVPPA